MRVMVVIDKIPIVFLGILALLLIPITAQARVVVHVDDDIMISFKSGDFDSSGLSGQIRDVEVFAHERRILTADELDIATSGKKEDGDHVIKYMRMKNIFFDDAPLSIKELSIRDIKSTIFSDIRGVSSNMMAISEQSNITLRDVAFSDKGVSMTIDNVTTLPFKFGEPLNGQPIVSAFGMQIENMIVTPLQNRGRFAHFVRSTGQLNFVLNMARSEINTIVDIVDDVVSVNMSLQAVMDNIGDLDAQMGIQMPVDTFEEVMAPRGQDDRQHDKKYADVALTDMKLKFADYGALRAAIQMSAIEQDIDHALARDRALQSIKSLLDAFVPQSADRLFLPFGKFINESGQIQLSAKPEKPFSFASTLQYIFAPDTIIKALNLVLTHEPHSNEDVITKPQKTSVYN